MALRLWRGRAKPPLRYFVYVSDAKLEMLFQQIDPKLLQRLSAEAKVDLKLASVTIKQAEQPSPTRMAKLKVVERYIDRHQRVGTVQEPGSQYFRGTMPVQWGYIRDPYAPHDSPNDGFNVAFFRGEQDGHTVALVGSRHHVLGEQPSARVNINPYPISTEPVLLQVIAPRVSDLHETAAMMERLEEDRRAQTERIRDSVPWAQRQAERAATNARRALYLAARGTDLSSPGPPRWMEFLAVPLIEGNLDEPTDGFFSFPERDWPKAHAVLATPIYVAHADAAS